MKTRVTHRTIELYRGCDANTLDSRLSEQLVATPGCATTRYLLGCRAFDRGRPASAVRHMMVAHHADADLESAALLVFAGMNAVSRPGVPLLTVLLDTWVEFRRPQFDRYARERRLLTAFAARWEGPPTVSDLTRRLWRLPIQTLRSQIREALALKDAERYPLLLAV